jgi:hypothetical protein
VPERVGLTGMARATAFWDQIFDSRVSNCPNTFFLSSSSLSMNLQSPFFHSLLYFVVLIQAMFLRPNSGFLDSLD